MTSAVLAAEGLTFAYPGHEVLRGFRLEVRTGEAHALLGPNGAGKTTALHLLLGLADPDAGSVRLFGAAPRAGAALQGVGAVLEGSPLGDPLWSPAEFLAYFAAAHGLAPPASRARARGLLAALGLARPGLRVGGMSQGMRRKLQLARALLHEPRLLVLDEPSNGLDIPTKHELWALLRRLQRERGLAILLCSHDREEVEALADRVTVLRGGRALGPLAPHPERRAGELLLDHPSPASAALGVAGARPGRVRVTLTPAEASAFALRAGASGEVGPLWWGRTMADTAALALPLLGVAAPAPPAGAAPVRFERVARGGGGDAA